MIIGFSHLTFTCVDLDVGIRRLMDLGYHLYFKDTGVENSVEKSSLLQDFNPTHDLAFLKKDGAINIELVNHHSTSNDFNNDNIPIFRSDHPNEKWLDAELNSKHLSEQHLEEIGQACEEKASFFYDVDLNLFLIWVSNKAKSSEGFIGGAIFSHSLVKAESLVKQLRFTQNSKQAWVFPSPFPSMSITLFLLQKDGINEKFLDSSGCTCLSFFGTDKTEAFNFLGQTETFSVNVNSSDLLIKFLYADFFPYVEVIQK